MRRLRDGEEGITAVMGNILMVAAVVALAGLVLVIALAAKQQKEEPLPYGFEADYSAGTIRVTAAPLGVTWDRLDVQGCNTVPTGPIEAGQVIRDCAGTVNIIDVASNILVKTFTFA